MAETSFENLLGKYEFLKIASKIADEREEEFFFNRRFCARYAASA